MASIELQNIQKWFDDTQVIRGIDLLINKGEFVVFVGPSGCGKSTLLRIIAGLEDTTTGSIFIDGNEVTNNLPSERGLSMVFQSYALYPHMSVRENIGFSLKTSGVPQSEINSRVGEIAQILKLEELLERRPKQLSGGQRQRVAIGRAIIREPKGFLFDEPLSNLDASLRVNMRLEISRLHQKLGITTIYVTHDQVEAMTLADRIVVINKGRIMQSGSPRELYSSPANRFVAEFIGSPKINLLACHVKDKRIMLSNTQPSERFLTSASDATTLVGIRPEKLIPVHPGKGFLSGRVVVCEFLGSEQFVHIDCGFEPIITVRVDAETKVVPGTQIGVDASVNDLHLFDNKESRIM